MNSHPAMAGRRSPTRQPMLWAAFAYSAGILAGRYAWRPPLWWLVAGIAFGSFAAYYRYRRARVGAVLALSSLFVFGALCVQSAGPGDREMQSARPREGEEAIITAHVVREGNMLRRGPSDFQQKLDLESEQIETEGAISLVHAGIRSSFYGKNSSQETSREFHYGDRVRFAAKLFRPRNFRNPGAFDYEDYLAQNGISFLASAKAAEVELMPGFSGNNLEAWRNRARHSVSQKIEQLWPPEQAALAEAMLMGDNSSVGRELLTTFQQTGTYHVLVISGLKVSILALVTFWSLRRLRASDVAAGASAVFVTMSYAALTGVGAPVWRATLMLALYFVVRFLYRRKSVLNAIGVAALILLLIDPRSLFSASFQLSFLCILIITAIGTPMLERTTQPVLSSLRNLACTGYDFALPPSLVQFRLDLRMVAARLQRFVGMRFALPLLGVTAQTLVLICEFLLISLVLQIGFTLPMAYQFHRATAVALPANILAVPLTEIALVACITAIGLGYTSLYLATIPAWLAGWALQVLSGTVRWMGHLRVADRRVATPAPWLILASLAALVLAMVLAHKRWRLTLAGLCVLTGCALWICIVPSHVRMQKGVLEVTAIDVGQGDSILLVAPDGHAWLVDVGGTPQWMHSDFDIGEDVVSPYLWSRGISRLDAIAITHAHADHIGGMKAVLENFHPGELWMGATLPSPELADLLRKARDLNVPVRAFHAGDGFTSGGVSFRILAPAKEDETSPRKRNDESLVMSVTYGHTTALLEGDAEKESEKRIAVEQPEADVLKIAHHGSVTSTIPELLGAVHPKFAVISVGARNVYGHPRMEVLQRLAEAHVRTYRTDLDGAVTLYLDGSGVTPLAASH